MCNLSRAWTGFERGAVLPTVRVLTADDVTQAYVDWFSNQEVSKYSDNQYREFTLSGQIDYVNQMTESEANLLYGVFDKDKHIGNVLLSGVNSNHKRADVSYVIGDPEYWGKGIATSAVGLICEIAFQELNLAKLTAGCSSLNIGSQKVLQRNQFVIEGVRKKHLMYNDEWSDQLEFGRLSVNNQ